MAPNASYIHEARKQFMTEIMPDLHECYTTLSASDEVPDLHYRSQLDDQTPETLAQLSIESDVSVGRTTKGIHKDDIEILLDGKPARKFGSQGQVKSLLIAMHIAQTHLLLNRTGRKPILLLDDIFDRLDDYRANKLVRILTQTPAAQVFITDASPAQMRELIRLSTTDAGILELKSETPEDTTESESRNLPDYASEEE
jgi:DNA replication and repair protein RecF